MKDSFSVIWSFLDPDMQLYGNRQEACRELWASIPLQRKRQIYATLFWQREQGVEIDENPYFAISHCKPEPFNYNLKSVPLPTDRRLYIAFYKGGYGLYSKLDTEAFQMTDKREFKV